MAFITENVSLVHTHKHIKYVHIIIYIINSFHVSLHSTHMYLWYAYIIYTYMINLRSVMRLEYVHVLYTYM